MMTAASLFRYGVVFLAMSLGVAVLVSFLNTRVDTALGSSAQIMVPAMIAALIEGSWFARARKRKPNRREAWNFAWAATAVAVVLNIGLAYGAGDVTPEFAKLAIAPPGSKQFLILLGLYAGGYLICNRFFLGLGAGNQVTLMRGRGEIE